MSSTGWVDPRIQLLRAITLRDYLLDRGWKLQAYPGPELMVFEGPKDDDGEPIVPVVPASEQLRDFRDRVEELLGALSVLEDRAARDILNDLLRENGKEQPSRESEADKAKSAVG